MFKILYKYFIINRRLNLPGIGVLEIRRLPASLDFTRKAFTPPGTRIDFSAGKSVADKKFFSFLSGEQNIEEVEAAKRFDVFVQELKDNLQVNGHADLPGLGTLTRKEAGGVHFDPVLQVPSFFQEMSIDRSVPGVVGKSPGIIEPPPKEIEVQPAIEEEREDAEVEKSNWRVYAIIIALLSIAAIVYYYTVNGSLN
jgi:hypothetical protein